MSFRPNLAHVAIALALLLGAPMLALAQPAPAPAQSTAALTQGDADYVLGPEDEVELEVLGRTDFKARSKVSAEGMIELPYIGRTKAAGLTASQLGDEVKGLLQKGGFYANPVLSVDIVSYASKYVTVLGEVAKPGLTPVDRPYRLSEMLAKVGGVRDTAADYITYTPVKGAQRKLTIENLATGGEAADPLILPGDKLYVPKAEVFYISGQVKAPGTYPLVSDMTVRMAIARGGGLTDLGTDHGVKVTHKGAVKPVKMKPEEKIQAGDVIVVAERLF